VIKKGNEKIMNRNLTVVNLDSDAFEEKLRNDKNAVLIDVRTKEEYSEGHLPGSKLINIMSSKFISEVDKLDRTKNYYLYCRSGSRSYHAAVQMLHMGFNEVYNLENGLMDWSYPLNH
jgi:rhodanese-related sulfurtransferase